MSGFNITNLRPHEEDCHLCGITTFDSPFSVPMYENVVVPSDWRGGWAGFTVCKRCFDIQKNQQHSTLIREVGKMNVEQVDTVVGDENRIEECYACRKQVEFWTMSASPDAGEEGRLFCADCAKMACMSGDDLREFAEAVERHSHRFGFPRGSRVPMLQGGTGYAMAD